MWAWIQYYSKKFWGNTTSTELQRETSAYCYFCKKKNHFWSENTMLTDSSVQRCCQSLFLVEVVSLVQTGTKIRKHFQKLSFQSFWWGAWVLKMCQSRFSQKKTLFLATSCFLHLILGPVPFHTNPNTALPLKEKPNCVWHWIQVAVGAFSSATK